jgi:hypothetical protein
MCKCAHKTAPYALATYRGQCKELLKASQLVRVSSVCLCLARSQGLFIILAYSCAGVPFLVMSSSAYLDIIA